MQTLLIPRVAIAVATLFISVSASAQTEAVHDDYHNPNVSGIGSTHLIYQVTNQQHITDATQLVYYLEQHNGIVQAEVLNNQILVTTETILDEQNAVLLFGRVENLYLQTTHSEQ